MDGLAGNAEIASFHDIRDRFSQIVDLDRGKDFAYASRPPISANLHDLVGKWEAYARKILYRPEAVLPDAQILRLHDALTAGRGAIMTRNGELIAESLHRGRAVSIKDQPDAEIDGFTVMLRKVGENNFGHWLIELCTRIAEFRHAFPDEDWKVAIPAQPERFQPWRMRTLEWMGIDQSRLVWLKENQTVRFKDLAFITSNSIHSHTHDARSIRMLSNAALKAAGSSEGPRRLYLSRSDTPKRQLLNEAEILPICQRYGFEPVYPGRHTVDEQVRLFSSAEAVVGVTGAALTNIMFAPESCKILSLNPDHGCAFFFWDIANILGQEFSYIFGPAANPARVMHSSFRVDPDLVSQWLADHMGEDRAA